MSVSQMFEDTVRGAFSTAERAPLADVDLAESRRVGKVVPGSPAERLGLAPGSILLTVNGEPAAGVDLVQAYSDSEEIAYVLRPPGSERDLEVSSNAMPLGVEWQRTSDAIRKMYRAGNGEHRDFDVLWRNHEHELMEELTRKWPAHKRTSSLRIVDAILHALFPGFLPSEAEWLYKGIALYESGKRAEGMTIMRAFREKYAEFWSTDYRARALYYEAMELLEDGEREQALEVLLHCYDIYESDRFAEAIRRLGGTVPDTRHPLVGRHFPVDFSFPLIDQPDESRTLSGAIGRLEAGQLHIVTMLANYRGNGPYREQMQHHLALDRHFRFLIPSMQVVAGSDSVSSYTLEFERKALEQGRPVEILSDPECELLDHVPISGSPTVMVLDADGVVRWTESMTSEVRLWEMLAEVSGASRAVSSSMERPRQ